MKQIDLKVVPFGLDLDPESKAIFNYQDALMDILRVREQGMDLVEMEKALSCIGKIKRGTDKVILDDAEHAYLIARVSEHKFRIADSALVQFVKDIRNAPAPTE